MKNIPLLFLYFVKTNQIKEFLRIMRISLLLLFVAVFQLAAINTEAQNAKVKINSNNISVKELITEIEHQTDFLILYRNNDLDVSRVVHMNKKSGNLTSVLEEAFSDTDINYELQNNYIVLSKNTSLSKTSSQQDGRTISGTVTDTDGEPIVGANITQKGTTNGTSTNVDGKFSITIPPGSVISVSYIGYITQEINAGNQTTFNIQLIEDTQALEEVVVIGYGVVKKSDLAGAVSSVSANSFKDQPVTRVEDALQGRMAGVEVTNMTGLPGGAVKIRVRGTTSISKGNDPLFVVDGIIRSTGLAGINTSDIQSMEVLKDASSTAIYGSRGANGVVLITTKRGQAGRAQITFETELGVAKMAKRYDLLGAYDYATMLNEVLASNTISDADLSAYQRGDKGIDWQDQMTQTGFNQNYRLSISGGNNDTKYFVSGNVLDQEAITRTTKYQRMQFRINLDTRVTPWLNLIADMNASRTKQHNQNVDLWAAFNYSPTMEMRNEATGIYNKDPYNNNIANNPYGMLVARKRDNNNNFLNGNLDLRFNIIDGLTFSVQGGLNFMDNPSYFFEPSIVAPNTQNRAENYTGRTLAWQNTNNLTYNKNFGDHSLIATAVLEMSKSEWMGHGSYGRNLQTESVGYWNVKNGTAIDADNGYSAEQMVSGVGRLMYSYKGRYIAYGTFRADGSSKFQGDNKWGYFPSGSVAWNMGEEDFIKDQDIFQQLKVRASAGIIGNQGIGRYETLGSLAATSYAYGTGVLYTGYWAAQPGTPDVSWEKTYQYDLGLDISILKSRLNFTADWFLKQTKDLLFQKKIPGYNGGGTYWVNQGEVKNTGLEFSINAIPFRTNDFMWESTLNATYVKNEVIDLAGEPFLYGPSPHSGLMGTPTIVEPGGPVGTFYLYEWAGLDANGANLYKTKDGGTTTAPSSDDKVVKGNANPDWTFGWNNMISWRNWEASVFINAAVGFDRLNITRFSTASMVGDTKVVTLSDAYFKGWDKVSNKADALYPSLENSDNRSFGDSDQWLENASFIKLRNISLAYRVPRSVSKFADIKLSFSCQNLWTITGYKGLDPEVIYTGSSVDLTNGVDYGAYPIPRTFTFGVKLDF